ncbi:ferric reductase-like transmembrane domain-containing protein [Subtercola sp. PAMC28395]|uniref:ferredoxin reductase family protein n=1 Tax=Subtercola sp. PAMC28395 TaxID=2846775 RepID=UPI001C0B8AAF|nr:ferredoxin reductase family protein [Subtercola sp. PAMC28395]QWT24375.1 ferric reductase-like transmembrane domain-containing protein [Subtercola sp. PAMC28395]
MSSTLTPPRRPVAASAPASASRGASAPGGSSASGSSAGGPAAGLSADTRTRAKNHRRRQTAADVMQLLCVTSVAASIALYLAYAGLADFTSLQGTINAFGIMAGLAGTDLILVMLVLAARVPWIDRTVGQDRAIALHRALGKPALYLILAHGVLLTISYAMLDQIDVVGETVSLLSSSTEMLLAYLGLGLLVLVVVTSIVAVRRRFAYEAWHLIHLLSYAAVLVALPHQLSTGGVLAEGTLQRVYWIALYVAAFGLVVVYRFALPIIRSARHGLRVTSVETIAPGVVSIVMSGTKLDSLRAQGGQYAVWRFWSANTWWHAHPISFSAVPTANAIRITVRDLGAGSARISRVPVGTSVSIEGPYGVFTDRARTSPYLSVVTAGIGITPVRAMLEHASLRPGEATVLLRASDENGQYLWQEVAGIASSTGSSAFSMMGHRPAGTDTWMSESAIRSGVTLETVFPHLHNSDLYICGPQAWADLVVQDARRAGLAEKQIHLERFES